MIKGTWGCGKTHFVKQYVDKCNSELMGMAWYISAFGVKGSEDLDNRLFEVAHPIITNKSNKKIFSLSYNIMRGAVKHKLGIEVNDFFTPLLEMVTNEKTTSYNCKVLFVDDIERSNMPLKELLGYFSQSIDKDTRVVFIADEDKIPQKEEFKNLKEKLISETYNIEPEYETAIRSFFQDEIDSQFTYLQEKAVNLARELKIDNLRNVRRIIHRWSILVENLPADIKAEKSYIQDIFEEFFVLYSNFINKKYDEIYLQSPDYSKTLQEMNDVWKEYNKTGSNGGHYYPELQGARIWPDVFMGGRYDDSSWLKDQFTDSHKQYTKKVQERENNRKEANRSLNKLKNIIYYNQNQGDIKRLFEAMEEDFSSGKYLRYDEIITFVQIYLTFMYDEILPAEYDVSKLVGKLNKLLSDHREEIYGLPGIEKASKESIMKVDDVSLQQCIEEALAAAQASARAKREGIFSNKEAFLAYIADRNKAVTEMTDINFLKKLNLDDVFIWLDDDIVNHKKLLNFLEFRYRINFANDELHESDYPEQEYVKILVEKYEEKCKSMAHNFRIDYREFKEILGRYRELNAYMERQINKNNKESK